MNYDPKKVICTVAGIPLSGFADGTFITVERNEDSFMLRVGVAGEACRAKNNNRSGRMTFTLLQSAACNSLLSGLNALDEQSPMGDGIGPFTLSDLNGDSLAGAEKCWIVKPASLTYSKEAETREWLFETADLSLVVGGDPS
jgi:hypothetical protein